MTKTSTKRIFPKNFLWGASTSAHQVDGESHDQWSVWELAHASELAKHAANRQLSPHSPTKTKDLPIWDDIKEDVQDPNNYVSGEGVKHYTRFKEDFDLLKKLNFNSFRFSISWSRLEPMQGQWNQEAVEHYREYIKELKDRSIEPVLNIWHWTNPVWFEEMGGFKKRENLKYFKNFVQKLSDEYGLDINWVLTINEPNNYAGIGFVVGDWPPQEKNIWHAGQVYINLVRAHKIAYKIFKKSNPKAQIGVATQLANIQAKRPHNLLDVTVTKIMRYGWNWWFLNRIKKYQDFVGFNYYFSDYYKGTKIASPLQPISDVGWYMEPEGLYPLLLRTWARYKKPIIVTENGVADSRDKYRQWWIQETLIAIERAMSEGIEVRGYMHWSLLDNFEWHLGWWPKFGLIEVDRKNNFKRTPRQSAIWFAKQIKQIQEEGML